MNHPLVISAAMFTPGVIFILIFNAVLIANLDEVGYEPLLAVAFGASFLVSTALCVAVFRRAGGSFSWDLSSRAIVLLGAAIFALEVLRPLTGSPTLRIRWVLLIELGALIVVTAVVLRASLGTLLLVLSVVAPIQVISAAYQQFTTVNARAGRSDVGDAPQSSPERDDLPDESQSSPNVYLVVFDAYQSQMYEYLRDERDDTPELPMTFFPEFRANSAKTWSSMTQLLGGAHYSPIGGLSEWRSGSIRQGLFAQLHHNGTQIHQYPYYGYHCYEFAAACDVAVEAKKDLGRGSSMSTVVDLWFLNLLPTTVRRMASGGTTAVVGATDWDYGFSLSESLLGRSERPTITDNAYFAVKQFERMLEDEQYRPARGQLVFAHLILPHTPYVVDGDCEYRGDYGTDDIDEPGFFEHSMCALRLLASLLERLEELGRLEGSLVIAMSDHGKVWHPALLGRLSAYAGLDATSPRMNADVVDSSSWSSEVVETRSSALLLVKRPGQQDGGDSLAPTQVIDIAPTIAAHFGLSTENYSGQPVGEIDAGAERERLFYAFNKFPRVGAPRVMSVYRNTGGNDWKYSHDIETVQ